MSKLLKEKKKKKKKKIPTGLKVGGLGLALNTLSTVPVLMPKKGKSVDVEDYVARYNKKNNDSISTREYDALLMNGSPAAADWATNEVYYDKNKKISEPVVLHELGHLRNAQNSSELRKKLTSLAYHPKVMRKNAFGGLASVPMAALGALNARAEVKGKKKNKFMNFVDKHPYLTGTAISTLTHAPILIEEGNATAFATKQMHKNHGASGIKDSIRDLGSAYGTYATMPLVSGGVSGSAYTLSKQLTKKLMQKKRKSYI